MIVDEDTDLRPVKQEDLLLQPVFTLKEEIPLSNEPEENEQKGSDALSKFDIRYREPFLGLIYLGSLDETVEVLGHKFRLKTPSHEERLETGLLHKKYLNSISSELAWAAVTLAAFLREVDGSSLPEPIGPAESGIRERFNWIITNMYGPVISRVYEQCLLLDSKVNDAINELERLGES